MSLAFKVFALSDLGLQREGNEDSGLFSPKLIAVADVPPVAVVEPVVPPVTVIVAAERALTVTLEALA